MGGGHAADRAISSVLASTMLVGMVMILAVVLGSLSMGLNDATPSDVPQISVSTERIADPSDVDESIAVTLDSGTAVAVDHLYVIGSTDLDIGGSADSGVTGGAADAHASSREKFTESSPGNPPQVGIGDTWESGETVYLDPVGTTEGTTIRIYWSSQPVTGVNPGTVQGSESYEIVTVTVS